MSARNVLLFVVMSACGVSAHGQVNSFIWNNPSGGSYSNANNWFSPTGSSGVPNGPNNFALFGPETIYTVDFFANFTARNAPVGGGNVTWNFGGGEATATRGAVLASKPVAVPEPASHLLLLLLLLVVVAALWQRFR